MTFLFSIVPAHTNACVLPRYGPHLSGSDLLCLFILVSAAVGVRVIFTDAMYNSFLFVNYLLRSVNYIRKTSAEWNISERNQL